MSGGGDQPVKLAPNVLSLPLRQPAVIARSVASLDILSGGRIELGIGAGVSAGPPTTGSMLVAKMLTTPSSGSVVSHRPMKMYPCP